MRTKGFMAILLMFVAITAFAQVPQNVNDAFKSKNPDATLKNFRHSGENYVATFVNGGEKHKATFNESGSWIQTITQKKWKEMPDAVRIALHRSRYGNWEVYECDEIETPTGTLYSFQVDNQYTLSGDEQPAFSEEGYVYFTSTGNAVNGLTQQPGNALSLKK